VVLGAGPRLIDGWLCLDLFPAQLCVNLDWPLPFTHGSVRRVYLPFILEHLFYQEQAHRLLHEVLRILEPGGVVRIVVPDMEAMLHAYAAGDIDHFAAHRQKWAWANLVEHPLEFVVAWIGLAQPRMDFFNHKMGYDFAVLKALLDDVGFEQIRRCRYQGSPHPELRIDTTSKDADAGSPEGSLALFVEAVRPAQVRRSRRPRF
jgi:predicted SAM-dependent methyltransferase